MKKCIAFILSLYMLLSTIVPCFFFDGCEEGQYTSKSADKESKKDCDNCSPFCICSPAHQFTSNTVGATIQNTAIFNNSIAYGGYRTAEISDYHATLFQPPRIG